MTKTPLELRWKRAKALASNGAIQRISRKELVWSALAYGSRMQPYNTQVCMSKWGNFLTGSCTCPDYVGMFAYVYHHHPFCSYAGVPQYNGRLVCKHMLALSLKAYLELEAEILQ